MVPAGFNSGIFRRQRDAIGGALFLHTLAGKALGRRFNSDRRIQLHSTFVKNLIGANYREIVDTLIHHRLINQRKHYIVRVKSMDYMFEPHIAAGSFRSLICQDQLVIARVARSYGPRWWSPNLTPTHRWLKKNVGRVRIHDLTAAIRVIHATPKLNEFAGIHGLVVREMHARMAEQSKLCRPDLYGRFHTPISRLPRQLRPFLSVGTEPLWSIDVRNAQPLLAALAHRLHEADPSRFDADRFGVGFGETTYLLAPIQTEDEDTEAEADEDTEAERPHMFPDSGVKTAQTDYWAVLKHDLQAKYGADAPREVPVECPSAAVTRGALHERYASQRAESDRLATSGRQHGDRDNAVTLSGGCPQDVGRYIDICERGRFYEHLMALPALAGVLPHTPAEARDQIKTAILGVFFDDPSQLARFRSPVWRALDAAIAAEFPTVHAFLRELRSGDRVDGRGYANAACTCQNLEASIVIGGVCGRLMAERPTMPVLTIHDSVLVPESAVPYVESVIRDEFGKWGLSPSFKSEPVAPAASASAVA